MKKDLSSARPWNGSKHKIFGSMKESEEQKANFKLALRAVNNHDALIEALKLAEATIQRLEVKHGGYSSVQGTLDVIKTAIKNAEK